MVVAVFFDVHSARVRHNRVVVVREAADCDPEFAADQHFSVAREDVERVLLSHNKILRRQIIVLGVVI